MVQSTLSPGVQSISLSDDDRCLVEEPSQSWWSTILSPVKVAANKNAGLLLVIAAQAFFSFMNVSVKILNTIDPPISAMQVCALPLR